MVPPFLFHSSVTLLYLEAYSDFLIHVMTAS